VETQLTYNSEVHGEIAKINSGNAFYYPFQQQQSHFPKHTKTGLSTPYT
jgi:hypothetical protein